MVGDTIIYHYVKNRAEFLCCRGCRPEKPLFLHMWLHPSMVPYVSELNSWRGGKMYMLIHGWIMNDTTSHSHGIAEGTGLANRNEEAACQG
jgi:hypothetical protein